MERRRIVKSVEINPEKIDHDNQLITTQLMMVNDPDTQGDRISKAEITKALDSYTLTFPRAVGRQHKTLTNSYPVAMGQDDAGNLHVTTKVVDDADWADIGNGKITGKSWAGWANSEAAGDGTFWLSNIEFDEYSLVDYPAVQTANFKSEDGEDEDTSLVAQLAAGQHTWRRRELGVAKGGDDMGWLRTALVKLGVMKPATKSDTSAIEGRENKRGGTLDMSEEQLKELLDERDAKLKEELTAVITEQFKALGKEAEDVDADVGEGEAIELGARMDELHDELGKLSEATTKAFTELAETIGKLPLASGKQNYDGGDGEDDEFKPARCAR